MIDTTNMGIMASLIQPTTSTMANHMISKKDSDSSSTLSISEMGIDSEAFTSYDLDADGSLTLSELTTAIDTAMSQFDGEMPTKEQFQSVLSEFGFEPPTNSGNSSLSSSQLDTISSVLENYDSSNLSQSDALEIVAAFKEAGIQPGAELEAAMKEAGFDAHEVGTLAGVGAEGQAGGGGAPSGGGGGQGGGDSSSETEYDAMDLNEDGVVSFAEMQEYYGTSSSSNETASSSQNTLDNLQLLMETLKSNSNGEQINANSFDGMLRAINNQNNNSEINTFLQSSSTTSSLFGYA